MKDISAFVCSASFFSASSLYFDILAKETISSYTLSKLRENSFMSQNKYYLPCENDAAEVTVVFSFQLNCFLY